MTYTTNDLNLFSTKKRSSELAWAWAGICAVAITVGAAFLTHELTLFYGPEVKFYNLRATTLMPSGNEAQYNLEAKTPFLYVGKDEVIFTTVDEAVVPRPKARIAYLQKSFSKEEITSKIKENVVAWADKATVFPSNTVAVFIHKDSNLDDSIAWIEAAVQLVQDVNGPTSSGKLSSVKPVLVEFAGSI